MHNSLGGWIVNTSDPNLISLFFNIFTQTRIWLVTLANLKH